jgi:trans-L-3-hydroxyproline dehydratase
MMSNTYASILSKTVFAAPSSWKEVRTIDMHTGGEPLRVILSGFPQLEGNSVLEYRQYCKDHYDHFRKWLMFEPRGHADMYGCLLVPPNDAEGDFGIMFLHNEGYSTMCGHAIIAISKLVYQLGWVERQEGENVLKIDAPCGRITSFVDIKNDQVQNVKFHCVPSFVVELDAKVDVDGLGAVTYDLAYGGAFYAYVDIYKNDQLDMQLNSSSYRSLITTGMAIKNAVIRQNQSILHPFETDLSFLYGTIFIGPPNRESNSSRNVCIFAEGEVDRCPTGSGVSGRIAIHRKRGEIDYGQTMKIESITDSVFTGTIVDEVEYGFYDAVIPEVSGTAYITGQHSFIMDPDDPLQEGFFLR